MISWAEAVLRSPRAVGSGESYAIALLSTAFLLFSSYRSIRSRYNEADIGFRLLRSFPRKIEIIRILI